MRPRTPLAVAGLMLTATLALVGMAAFDAPQPEPAAEVGTAPVIEARATVAAARFAAAMHVGGPQGTVTLAAPPSTVV
ncbi:MAG: hypothetical protein KJN71_01575, partial [Acidimicrobiia bacterium]|nr:hypothetical protein [Acidimicrobiia bacterium]